MHVKMRMGMLHPNTQQVPSYVVRGKRLLSCPRPYRVRGNGLGHELMYNEIHRRTSQRLASHFPQCLGAENHGQDSSEKSDDSTSASIDLDLPRRSRQVTFTCNKCGGRTERLVNPVAWEKGMVIVQCEHCKAWHKIADAANMVEEYRYQDEE